MHGLGVSVLFITQAFFSILDFGATATERVYDILTSHTEQKNYSEWVLGEFLGGGVLYTIRDH